MVFQNRELRNETAMVLTSIKSVIIFADLALMN